MTLKKTKLCFISILVLIHSFSCKNYTDDKGNDYPDGIKTRSSDKYIPFTLKKRDIASTSTTSDTIITLKKDKTYLIDSSILEKNTDGLEYIPILLPNGKFYIPSTSKIKLSTLPESYHSFVKFLDYAWILYKIKNDSTLKKEDFLTKLLYEKYGFSKLEKLDFKQEYTLSEYQIHLRTLLNRIIEEDEFNIKIQLKDKIELHTQLFSDQNIVDLFSEIGKVQFIHFNPKKNDSGERAARVILNLKPKYILYMVDFIQNNFDSKIRKFKMGTYHEFNERKDNFILYVSDLDFARQYLNKIHSDFLRKYPNSFNKSIPYMTEKIQDGMAIAEQHYKHKGLSFGDVRCKLINYALCDTKSANFTEFLQNVLAYFTANGIDFFAPHKNLRE